MRRFVAAAILLCSSVAFSDEAPVPTEVAEVRIFRLDSRSGEMVPLEPPESATPNMNISSDLIVRVKTVTPPGTDMQKRKLRLQVWAARGGGPGTLVDQTRPLEASGTSYSFFLLQRDGSFLSNDLRVQVAAFGAGYMAHSAAWKFVEVHE